MAEHSHLIHIREILTQLLQSYDSNSILPKDLLLVAVKGMEYYDMYLNDQTGDFKKISLIQMLHRIIRAVQMPDGQKDALNAFVDSAEFSLALDLIISASKGKFHLNAKQKRNIKSFFCCSSTIHPNLDHAVQSFTDTVELDHIE